MRRTRVRKLVVFNLVGLVFDCFGPRRAPWAHIRALWALFGSIPTPLRPLWAPRDPKGDAIGDALGDALGDAIGDAKGDAIGEKQIQIQIKINCKYTSENNLNVPHSLAAFGGKF